MAPKIGSARGSFRLGASPSYYSFLVSSHQFEGISPTYYLLRAIQQSIQPTTIIVYPSRTTSPSNSFRRMAASQSTFRHAGDRSGRCSMRGSCGKKSLFGKPLPCPTDELASEVCFSFTCNLQLDPPFMTGRCRPRTSSVSLWF